MNIIKHSDLICPKGYPSVEHEIPDSHANERKHYVRRAPLNGYPERLNFLDWSGMDNVEFYTLEFFFGRFLD